MADSASSVIAALLSGAAMGFLITVLGAGGSLFIVPVLVFGYGQPVSIATGTSLVVVFAAALVGAFGHARRGHVRVRVALLFGAASMVGAVVGALLQPHASEDLVLRVFAITLVAAAARMAFGRAPRPSGNPALARILPLGFAVGVLTGFVGVGGGFLIVPVIAWGAGLDLRDAIGTSLAIIAIGSMSGAVTHVLQGNVDGALASSIGAGAVIGAVLGGPISGRLPERPLRIAFAIMVIGAAAYVLYALPSLRR